MSEKESATAERQRERERAVAESSAVQAFLLRKCNSWPTEGAADKSLAANSVARVQQH